MKKVDCEIARQVDTSEPLPAGGYVAKVMDVEEVSFDWGSRLVISFDISEGDFAGFFGEKFKNSEGLDYNKWKGVYRLTVPNEDSEWFESQKKTFGNAIWAFEDGNEGFKWKWKEKDLVGKEIGVLFRNREYSFNGYEGWTTECSRLTSANDIRNGSFKVPKDKPLKDEKRSSTANFQYSARSANVDFEEIKGDDDLPF